MTEEIFRKKRDNFPELLKMAQKLKKDDPEYRFWMYGLLYPALMAYGESKKHAATFGPIENGQAYDKLYLAKYGADDKTPLKKLIDEGKYFAAVTRFDSGATTQEKNPEEFKFLVGKLTEIAKWLQENERKKLGDPCVYKPANPPVKFTIEPLGRDQPNGYLMNPLIFVLNTVKEYNEIIATAKQNIEELMDLSVDPLFLRYTLQNMQEQNRPLTKAAIHRYLEAPFYTLIGTMVLNDLVTAEWRPKLLPVIKDFKKAVTELIKEGKVPGGGNSRTDAMAARNEAVTVVKNIDQLKEGLELVNWLSDEEMDELVQLKNQLNQKIPEWEEGDRTEVLKTSPIPERTYKGKDADEIAKIVGPLYKKKWKDIKEILDVVLQGEWREINKIVTKWDKYSKSYISRREHYMTLSAAFITDRGEHDDELWIYPVSLRKDASGTTGGTTNWTKPYPYGEGGGYRCGKDRVKKALGLK